MRTEGCDASPTAEQERLLHRYAEAVTNAPPPLHLTSENDRADFRGRHVDDALALLPLLRGPVDVPIKVIDIGSGNGVPGLPLAICRPNWPFSLLDSDNKKCSFIDAFCVNNDIHNVHVLWSRAEEAARGSMREAFDIVLARAVGQLSVVLELAAGFAKTGGLLIVPHGTSWEEALVRSKHAIRELSVEFVSSNSYFKETGFRALVFSKIAPLSDRYPRRTGIPTKRPL